MAAAAMAGAGRRPVRPTMVVPNSEAERVLAAGQGEAERRFYESDPEARALTAALAEASRALAPAALALASPRSLDGLVQMFGLSFFERQVLALCLAPALNPSFERLYGYLQEDATRRHATPELALALFSHEERLTEDRLLLLPDAPLRRFQLIVAGPAESLSATPLHLAPRVLSFLGGADRCDERVLEVLRPLPEAPPVPSHAETVNRVAGWLRPRLGQGAWPRLNLVGPDGAGKAEAARALGRALQLRVLRLDLRRLAAQPGLVPLLERDSVLAQLAFYASADGLDDAGRAAVEDLLGRLRAFLILGSREPVRSSWPVLAVPLAKPDAMEQRRLWEAALGGTSGAPEVVAAIVEQFNLGPSGIALAAQQARAQARLEEGEGAPVGPGHLWAACRAQASAGMQGLAERLVPRHGWEDLVVPALLEEQFARDRRAGAPAPPRLRRLGLRREAAPRPRHQRAVRGPQRHRQDHGRRGAGRRARARPVPDRPVRRGQQVHRRDREEPRPRSSTRPSAAAPSCSSTRPTPCSASAPRSRTATTATPTSRSTTCSSAWRSTGGWPSWRPT